MLVTSEPYAGGPPRHDVPRGGRSVFAVVDGRQVHYLTWGQVTAPAVLALHGGGQTAYMWEELGAALAPARYVVAPDLPGHGESDPLPAASPLGRHAIAAGVPPLLRELGLDRVVVLGASLGGIVGLTLAVTAPPVVAGLVLVDVGHRLEEAGVRRILDFMAAHESFGSLDEAAREIAAYLPWRTEARPESLRRNLRLRPDGRWVWKHPFGHGSALASAGPDEWRQVVAGLDEDAARIGVPVLVLRGAHSDVLSGEGAEELAALLPDARVAVVERARHLVAGDDPRTTVSLIRGFLDELGW